MNTRREVRPEIAAAMKREVRQRCAFGCVICGMPIFEYHHMTPWSEVHTHGANNLTLLCDLHHNEATGPRPLLTESQVRRANANPFNIRTGTTRPHMLHFEGPECIVTMGGNTFRSRPDSSFCASGIDGHRLLWFRFEDGVYLLQFQYFTPENKLALQVVDNEIAFASELWDVHWQANQLVIRRRLRDIVLDIEFHPPNRVTINRGVLHLNGVKVEIARNYVNNGGGQWLTGSLVVGPIGMHAGHDQSHAMPPACISNKSPTRLPAFENAGQASCLICSLAKRLSSNTRDR